MQQLTINFIFFFIRSVNIQMRQMNVVIFNCSQSSKRYAKQQKQQKQKKWRYLYQGNFKSTTDLIRWISKLQHAMRFHLDEIINRTPNEQIHDFVTAAAAAVVIVHLNWNLLILKNYWKLFPMFPDLHINKTLGLK